MMRTHYCGQVSEKEIGQTVSLVGWVHRRRDHGKLIFIDLRDRTGLIQIVFNPKEFAAVYEQANQLRNECVVSLKGKVGARPAGTENPKISTGKIEILANELTILNACQDLPFEIEDDTDVSEELRLAYRYLDLRRPKMLNNLILRHKIYRVFRQTLDEEGFIDVETPILTKSTPEGARDYLVPSRLNPFKFFALPQSPQLFKQILMVAGLDKYFQIAKCFRDEDLRADRQPEFTQLDLEMSFINEEDIFALSEKLMYNVFKYVKNIELNLPFKRINYQEAMEKYKSDKPNIGTDEFNFVWVNEFPLFKYNDEEKRWESEHHPFTSPKEEDISFIDNNQAKVRSRSYDLVLNGQEIASGSIRIHDTKIQAKIFKVIGLSPEESRERFGFLLDAFKFGAPPHGGIAFGLDRLIAIASGASSIREVIAFPKTQKAICPLTDAPSTVEDKQLKELGIKHI